MNGHCSADDVFIVESRAEGIVQIEAVSARTSTNKNSTALEANSNVANRKPRIVPPHL
jgi:hypothetical protein